MRLLKADELTRRLFEDMIDDYVLAGTPFLGITDASDFPFFVRTCVQHSIGIGLGKGVSPYTRYFLINDEEMIVAQGDVRHKLTPHNINFAGQLGYGTLPSYRNRGYATLMCGELLRKAKQLGLERIIITCDASNAASAKVIEKNGGKLLEVRFFSKEKVYMKRYEVVLTE